MNNKPKSMKTAFIRVAAENNTKDGLKTYTIDDIRKMVNDFCDRYQNTKYAYIMHDKDENADGRAKKHYHIVFKFKNPIKFKYLCDAFPYSDIQAARKVNACVQYLIHKNNPEKTQYAKNDIYTNFEQDEFDALFINDKKIEKVNEQDELHELIDKITSGEIRKYHLTDDVDGHLYCKYATQITRAFDYFHLDWCLHNRNSKIQVWFFTGIPGGGKSSYAQAIADMLVNTGNYKGVCVGGSSNDPLEEYGGQDILVLEDLRDNAFRYNDLLKLLGNNTRSASASRYRNKTFYGKLIFITSFEPLEKWYKGIKEDKKQLYRRITKYFETTNDNKIIEYNINKGDILHKQFVRAIYNPVSDLIALADGKEKPQIEFDPVDAFVQMSKTFGVDIPDDLKQKIIDSYDLTGACLLDNLPF